MHKLPMKDVFPNLWKHIISVFTPFRTWESHPFRFLQQDIIAGAAVAFVLIPQALAYAQTAGLPAMIGLYASFLPVIVAAIWGSSRFLSTGPVVVVSLLVFTSLSEFYTPGSLEYVAAAAVLAALVGVVQLFLGLSYAGKLVRLVSHPVILGFTNAAAIIIALHQVPPLLGLSLNSNTHLLVEIISIFSLFSSIHLPSFWIGLLTLVLLFAGKQFFPKFPTTLAVLILTTLYSWLTGFNGKIIGDLPTGLPPLGFFELHPTMIKTLFIPAVVIALVSFMEAVSVAKHLGRVSNSSVDSNQLLISQGLANISSAFSGGYPIAGSFSRSAVAYANGAKSPMAAIFTGVCIAFTLVFLTPFLYFLPQATLSGIIIAAVWQLLSFKQIKKLFDYYHYDGHVALVTLLSTFFFAPHLDYGIIVGIGASLLVHAHRTTLPSVYTFLANDTEQLNIHDIKIKKFASNEQVLLVLFDHNLLFTNAETLKERIIKSAAAYTQARYVVLLAKHISFMDSTATDELEDLATELRQMKKTLLITGLRPKLAVLMEQTKSVEVIGKKHLFPKSNEALSYVHRKAIK